MIEEHSTSLGKLERRDAILLLGGTSDIGGEMAVRLCWQRHVILAARRPEATDYLVERLKNAGASQVDVLPFEAQDLSSHRELIQKAHTMAGAFDYAIVAFGVLGDQKLAEHDEKHSAEIATINYTAQINVLTILTDILRSKQETRATVIAFSSIAGWRARRRNYVYGSTKAGLDAFCQGLTDALYHTNVRLITVRPGFVIGSMTKGLKPAPFSVTPRQVASAVVSHMVSDVQTGHFRSSTLWVPNKLKYLAVIMRVIPRFIWRRAPR